MKNLRIPLADTAGHAKEDIAWALVLEGQASVAQTAGAAGVSRSRVSRMRAARDRLGPFAQHCLTWSLARTAARFEREWKEEKAKLFQRALRAICEPSTTTREETAGDLKDSLGAVPAAAGGKTTEHNWNRTGVSRSVH